MFRKILLICLVLLSCGLSLAKDKTFFPASDERLQFWGRHWSDGTSTIMSWPGATLTFRFTGSRVKLLLADSTRNTFWTKLDQNEWQRFDDIQGMTEISLTDQILPPGKHQLTLVKKTETGWDRMQVKGILLEPGETLLDPPGLRKHKIEFIGDSITAGFKVHGDFNNKTSDGRLTYGYQAAEQVGAEPQITAISGIGVSHNYLKASDAGTLPGIYRRVDCGNDKLMMDFSKWVPDIITVNLGTNDNGIPVGDDFFDAHALAFLRQLRDFNPKSWILVLEPFHGFKAANWKRVVAQRQKEKDKKVVYIDTTGWLNPKTDCTDGTHLNPTGNSAIASKLVPVLKQYLK